MTRFVCSFLGVLLFCSPALPAIAGDGHDVMADPVVAQFLAGGGFGSLHAEAPPETEQFGQLVGVWLAQPEMMGVSGEFVASAVGFWTWKYELGGFAVRDLWYQSGDNLPDYMKHLGRDYLLTSIRAYDPKQKHWNVAWMANSAGKTMGMDFGTFTAVMEEGAIVMTSPSEPGGQLQRVVFSEITEKSFLWESDYSADGTTWMTVMRIRAIRLE